MLGEWCVRAGGRRLGPAAFCALVVCLTGLVRAQNPRLNLLKNSGFEQVADGKPVEWTIADTMSTLSSEQVHAGKQSLKIVDADEKNGSNVLSPVFSVIPKREYFLRGWVYLQEGNPRNPLGIYLWSLDEQGKEVRGPGGKQSNAGPRLTAGRWVQFFQPMTVFPGAQRVRVVVHTFSTATCTVFVDDIELLECVPGVFGDAAAWSGGCPDNTETHAADYSVRWSHADADQLSRTYQPPLDWSKYTGLSLWLHANKATGNAFVLVLASDDPKTEGPDYYSVKIPVEWTGWKQFVFPFKDMAVGRKPIGFRKIERIYFASTGWNVTPNPDLVIQVEDLRPVNVSQ